MGTGTWLISSGILARVVGVTATSGWIMTSVVAAASVGVLSLPGSLAVLRDRARDALDLGIVLGLAAAVWWPVGVAALRVTWAPLGSTPWYYLEPADQVAENHFVPATSTEWGVTVPFLGDYHLFTTATAMLLQQGGAGVGALHAVMVVAVALVACGAWALASALGAGRRRLRRGPGRGRHGGRRIQAGVVPSGGVRPGSVAHRDGVLRLVAATVGSRGAGVHVCGGGRGLRRARHRCADRPDLLRCCRARLRAVAFRASGVRHARRACCGPGRRRILAVRFALGMKLSAVNAAALVDRGGTDDPTWQFSQAIKARPFTSSGHR